MVLFLLFLIHDYLFFVLEKQSFMCFNFCTFYYYLIYSASDILVRILSLYIFLLCPFLCPEREHEKATVWRIT